MEPIITDREPSTAGGFRPLRAARTSLRGSARWPDSLFKLTTLAFALLVAGLVVLIIIEMASNSTLAFRKFGFDFITGTVWDPVRDEFGALPFIYGTAVSSLIGLLIAVPVSIGVAVFLTQHAPRQLSTPISFLVQLLAAIPSVVYGLWGIFVLAPLLRNHVYPAIQSALGFLPTFQGNPNGLGLMTAGIILSIMIVPIITAVTTDVMRAVPGAQSEASLALGATEWEATLIVLQNARSGITGAIILGLGRAVGETMAVTMVIGNRPEISASLFEPSFTIASAIANEFTEATSEVYRHALVEMGLILFVITFAINAAARFLVWGVTRGRGRAAHA
ncbi:MAG TPA: phosphate ABC transporter permease subunit PstC [Blastocatellia bacterium]|jgi:phosphate transport system permease protein|nr:phosphate ABC transporter permease subunit PstC [Blastocatellia bacterium]